MRIVLLPCEFPGKALPYAEEQEFVEGITDYTRKHWWAKWLFAFFNVLYNPRTSRLERVEVIVALEKPDDETFKFFYLKFKDGVTIKRSCYLKM